MGKLIWVITTIEKCEKSRLGFTDLGDVRVWGFYYDIDKALDTLRRNRTDLNEGGAYPYAVLEAYSEGIGENRLVPIWFEYDLERDGYFEIETPEPAEHSVNIAIG